ncbi:glycosyltransferase family 4 protein [bacterium]|nr:glycosyltransferase family 4 protein [bacterium]
MKILYYNWIQFDNKEKQGGGVNIYQKNLIEYLVKNTNHDIYFLSSGWKYNSFKKESYIKETKNIFENKCRTFEIINSSIIAPAFAIFMNPQKFVEDNGSYEMLKKFIEQYGPFDVIHFNNMEGLSINSFKIKQDFPNTKIIFSIHNYQPICPLVQYFQNHNKCICNDFNNGEECLKCAVCLPSKKEYINRYRSYLYAKVPEGIFKTVKPFIKIYTKLFKFKTKAFTGSKSTMKAEMYELYRKHNIEQINKYVDKVLAVSDRVREIMISHGVNPEIIKTSYIGTKVAESELGHSIAPINETFTISYLGYERIDKGYFFLLDALSELDDSVKSKLNIILAVAHIHEKEARKKLNGFNSVKIYNGYNHQQLKEILEQVNLGIVPVLWEDNLPQVAIEMVANGVPVLCSSFGGASELCTSELFKFEGGNIESFKDKLSALVNNPKLLDEYWKNHWKLRTMPEHIKELELIYEGKDK